MTPLRNVVFSLLNNLQRLADNIYMARRR